MPESLQEAHRILQALHPETSANPETLGLWGAVHKQLWDATRDRSALDEGIAAYEHGFYMKLDHYTGINYVFMLNERANQQTDPEEATADRLIARRVARQLLTIVETEIDNAPRRDGGPCSTRKIGIGVRRRGSRRCACCRIPGSPKLATRCTPGRRSPG